MGSLLVASPTLRDPNFARAVVLLLDHGEEGAVGVVLNRPSHMAVGEPLPQWRDRAAEPAVVFVGGPVARGSAICLARSDGDERSEGWQPLFDRLGTLDLGRGGPGDVGVAIDRLRVFAGYAGWASGQLEAEIAAGGWFVVGASPADVLGPEPEGLWRAVLRRQGGLLAAVASFPAELSVN